MMSKVELQHQVDRLAPWHYCHVLPYGIKTGTCKKEDIGGKMKRLIKHGAFPKATYSSVLDLGANSGMISMWFVDHKESHVVAIERGDRYYPQLELAVLVKGYSERITPVLADICDLGFGKSLFDLVLFLGTLHHVGPQEFHRPIFEACWQALKNGGDMVVQTKTEMPVMEHLAASGFTSCLKLYTHGERTAWKGTKP